MTRISFLQDVFASLIDRRSGTSHIDDERPLQELSTALLSARGEVSGNRLSHAILSRFAAGESDEKIAFS